MANNKRTDPLVRFNSKWALGSEPPPHRPDLGPCWLWTTRIGPGGYVQFMSGDQKQMQAHRWSYKYHVGPIPEGLDLDHLCHDPSHCAGGPTCPHRACVNPAHLEPVTRQENLRRGVGHGNNGVLADWQKAKTHCPRGHPYDEENTYVTPSRPNARYCRECHRLHTRYRRALARGLPAAY